MNFTIDESNTELLNYLNKIEDKNLFINKILNIGFKNYQSTCSNSTSSVTECRNGTYLENNNLSVVNAFNEQFDNLKLLINEIKLEQQNNQLQLNTNNTKGNIGEQLIYDFFKKNKYNIEDTSHVAHSGDLKLYLEEINENVLIEIKNYKNTVDQKQIDKFYYDLNYTGIKLGIFISLHSKIVNIKYPIEWKSNDNEILIFISECKEEYLYLAIYSLILLFKNKNYKTNLQLIKDTELFNDIKHLTTQKDSINKIKQEILLIHENNTKSLLTLYNNLCIFDNNFNYTLNKIYNKLENKINKNINEIQLNINKLNYNYKNLLELFISDLQNKYNLELIDNKKILINDKENIYKGEFKLLKTTINLILDSGLEIKNINLESWETIKKLLNC